jgi:hypothetical protein
VAVRQFCYHLLRPLINVISLVPAPLRLKQGLASFCAEVAIAKFHSGDSAAIQIARYAVSLCPDYRAYTALSEIMLPGESYYDLLRRFHYWLRPKSYIEIGVNTGASIVLANPPTVAVGIDPEARLLNTPKTVCKMFRFASDEYFATRDPRQDIEGETVDLAFIDGSHLFEQALRDFINIERVSSPTTVVLIHDCYAIDAFSAQREKKTEFWTGDVWKIIPCLREFRPDLQVFTIATRPSGLGVVSRLNSHSTTLINRYDEIVSRYISRKLDPDEDQRRNCAAMVANNWPEIVTRLKLIQRGLPRLA